MSELASLAAQTAIKTGGGILASMFNQGFAKRNSELQVQATKDLANFENRMQLSNLAAEMPIKMQSYRNAGLSTAALAGQFGGNLSVPNPSAAMPQTPGGGMQLDLDYLGMLQQKANVDLTAANERNVEADTEYKKSMAYGQRLDNYLKEVYGDDLSMYTIANMKASEKEILARLAVIKEEEHTQSAQTAYINALKELTDKQRDMLEKNYDIELKKVDPYIAYLMASAHSSEADVPLKESQSDLNKANSNRVRQLTPLEVKRLNAEVENIKAQTKLSGEMIMSLAAQRAYIRQLTESETQRKLQLQFDNRVRKLLGAEWVADREKSRRFNERLQAIGSIMHFGVSGSGSVGVNYATPKAE